MRGSFLSVVCIVVRLEGESELLRDAAVLGREDIHRVLLHHRRDVLYGVGVARELVVALRGMDGVAAYLCLALAYEMRADIGDEGQHDVVEEMVAVEIHIRRAGTDAEAEEATLCLGDARGDVGMRVTQGRHLLAAAGGETGEEMGGVVGCELAEREDAVHVGDGHHIVATAAIEGH